MTCSLTRIVVLAGAAGVTVSSLTGRDLWGLAAALLVGVVAFTVERVAAHREQPGR